MSIATTPDWIQQAKIFTGYVAQVSIYYNPGFSTSYPEAIGWLTSVNLGIWMSDNWGFVPDSPDTNSREE